MMEQPRDTFLRPLRDLRVSVTDRCNFRCPYCMPAEVFGERYKFLPRTEILSFEEIARLVRILVPLGVRKVRLTGGEPLLRADLPTLVRMLADLEGVEDLTLTSNAFLLAEHATRLRDAGLGRVTISLDSLEEEVFQRMNGGRGTVARVLEGIEAAERAGLTPIKINCVVEKGVNDHTVVDLAEHFRGTGHIVRFIEFMDVGTLNQWDLSRVVPAKEIVERIAARFPLEPLERDYRGEVARRWGYRDGAGEIGVIASVTEPFCADCTRARLSPEGQLVTCLFASSGHDLRAPLRSGASDEEIRQMVQSIWGARSDRYSEERAEKPTENSRIEMFRIGG